MLLRELHRRENVGAQSRGHGRRRMYGNDYGRHRPSRNIAHRDRDRHRAYLDLLIDDGITVRTHPRQLTHQMTDIDQGSLGQGLAVTMHEDGVAIIRRQRGQQYASHGSTIGG